MRLAVYDSYNATPETGLLPSHLYRRNLRRKSRRASWWLWTSMLIGAGHAK